MLSEAEQIAMGKAWKKMARAEGHKPKMPTNLSEEEKIPVNGLRANIARFFEDTKELHTSADIAAATGFRQKSISQMARIMAKEGKLERFNVDGAVCYRIPQEGSKPPPPTPLAEKVLKHLAESSYPLTNAKVRQLFNVSEDSARKAMRALELSGQIKVTWKNRIKHFTLPHKSPNPSFA